MKFLQVYNWSNIKHSVAVKCILCRGLTTLDQPLCSRCLALCPVPLCFCPCCGLPIEESDTGLCSGCLREPPVFDCCLAPFLYQYPVNRILQMVKYQSRLELINPVVVPLAQLLLDHYSDDRWPEVILPVPLHNKRLRERGYDQALLLARALQRQLRGVAPRLDDQLLKRVRHTPTQQQLDANARQKNIRRAFVLRERPACKHVAVLDDVVTTGATVSEITRLLKNSAVERVDIWSIARTPDDQIKAS